MVSNYFYCRIRTEGLFYDAQHDLLARAKFLESLCYETNALSLILCFFSRLVNNFFLKIYNYINYNSYYYKLLDYDVGCSLL